MLVRSYLTCNWACIGPNVFCHVHQYNIGKYDTLLIGLIQIWPNYINFNIKY